jgi:tetratricopeptide (TPR) repeat protein
MNPRSHPARRCLVASLLSLALAAVAPAGAATRDEVEATLAGLNAAIAHAPTAAMYARRGDAYYLLDDMERAVADYTTAIRLDDRQDGAWFGRGMALGRMGRVDAGIADLDMYIRRHPRETVALTKRGVRNIWRNNLPAAEHDLKRAVALDPKNAEAHDDLGVVYARTQRLQDAARHFATAIELDRTYQKAYHNLAICYHLAGQDATALQVIDAGLALHTDNRSSLLLKSAVLEALGRKAEAGEIAERAEFLPEDNWTERSAIGDATTQGAGK